MSAPWTDLSYYYDDKELFAAAERCFENIVNRRMYITGATGSTCHGEAFSVDYDLPNRIAYAETCASIALALFAQRMIKLCDDTKYADIVERTIYNGILSGISMDGKSFFYENPLEIDVDLNKVNTAAIAAMPEAKAKPLYPFSRSLIKASRAALVGLPDLAYSHSGFS